MFLHPDDVYRMTKKRRYTAQRRALDSMQVRYVVAKNGEPLVPKTTVMGEEPKQDKAKIRWDRV